MATTAAGQSGRRITPPPSAEAPVVRIETREVILPLNAYDADGRNTTDLAPADILVIEDGLPRPVTDLRRDPASIVLVLDLANEIGTFKNGATQRREPKAESSTPIERNAPVWERKYDIIPRPAPREFADNFVSELASGDEIAVIQYSDRVQLIQDWTSDRESALAALRSKYRIGLKSRYYDALGLAAEKLRDRTGRKVIVMLTDGVDTASRLREREAHAAIERTGAAIFIVGWKEVLTSEISFAIEWIGRRERQTTSTFKRVHELRRFMSQIDGASYTLQQLASESGGEWIAPEDFDALVSGAPRSLHREIGAQYSLAFLTERGPGLEPERRVDVLPARKGLTIRARRRYYIGDAVGQ
ncbi:MAG: VWA domain-containing protein [Acidobacteria bacterium]|nr:VWA domain-containing protein [Acidobacteriota bacterium]MCW5968079.1 VWA domain-containing protein [Blastocatellales bacterium]